MQGYYWWFNARERFACRQARQRGEEVRRARQRAALRAPRGAAEAEIGAAVPADRLPAEPGLVDLPADPFSAHEPVPVAPPRGVAAKPRTIVRTTTRTSAGAEDVDTTSRRSRIRRGGRILRGRAIGRTAAGRAARPSAHRSHDLAAALIHRPSRLAMKARRSNKWTSCSFFNSAPCKGG